jgi:BlaI family transcriptional regulator, penicillinase repressor
MRNDTSRNTESPSEMGELEHAVMQHVWEKGPCTAEAVREALLPRRVLKDSTIRTVLRRLEDKGFVKHDIDNRTFLYRAAAARQQVAAKAVQRIMDWFCGGSAEELLVGMVDSAVLDREELQRLAARIARGKSKGDKK